MDSCNGSRRPPQRLLGGMAGRLVAVLTNRSRMDQSDYEDDAYEYHGYSVL